MSTRSRPAHEDGAPQDDLRSNSPVSEISQLEGSSVASVSSAPMSDDESPDETSCEKVGAVSKQDVASRKDKEAQGRWKLFDFRIKRRHLVALLFLVISWKGKDSVEQFNVDEFLNQTIFHNLNETMFPLSNYLDQEKKRPGYQLAQRGARAKYPIVMIPGFVTSGLEVWQSKECGKKFFRQRLWTAITAARSFILDKECWGQHMMLDPVTGGDPEGISLRAAQGFEAADYFVGNYWVWGKLIVNLGDIGYNPSIMSMEPYDWRLSFQMVEKRDGYLTKLKSKIEAMHKTTGMKVVLATHSMGAMLVHYFFAWVTTPEQQGGGGGGKDWVDKHVHTYVNIAGSHLGVPKAASALFSGEMSDTVLTGMMANVVENFFSRRRRRDLWTTWGSLWAMLPKGGDRLWGVGADLCSSRSQDDPFCPENSSISPMFHITQLNRSTTEDQAANLTSEKSPRTELEVLAANFAQKESHTAEEINSFLIKYGAGRGSDTSAYRDFALNIQGRKSPQSWHDVTITPLPHAPNMKIFCLYGVGNPTERAYHYQEWSNDNEEVLDTPHPSAVLDISLKDEALNTTFGTRFVDGDGSVPLLSLGYICADAWRRPETKLNPSRSKVVTREYAHASEFRVDDPMRGGPESSDHVDILGNDHVTYDFLRIVSDFEQEQVEEDHITSDIMEIAQRINSSPLGGVRREADKVENWKAFLNL
ncbi:phospholipid:diacylglycerol acyltransferase [Fistulifera solaris]|uniref:Phospholipid:diacylglycerol acyltransferase n=1 Tax=Fistulifera solaris TaxID=1519565 RepID=A0A1Z5KEC0_FISSO|nr:phospholipid:diacylglycerol acyltransferase [Fistulifera solaris]|eukprot:GAX24664.1 phospholipid:diacylglycerol acyltransferase [Fistulifera solaris]